MAITQNTFQEFDGIAAPALSPAGAGRIYFDSVSLTFKSSESAGPYFDLAGPFTKTGSVVRLKVLADTIAIGAAAMVGTEKVRIVGDLRTEGIVQGTAFTFPADPDTGISNPLADSVAVVTAGGTRVTISTLSATFALPIFGVAGTAASPGYSFSVDPNTGMYCLSPGADVLFFATGGTERVRIDSAGRVGIAVTPSSPARLAFKDHVAFPGSEGSFTTAGNTITGTGTLVLFQMTLADNTLYWFEAMIIGRDVAGVQRMFYVRWVRAHRQGGGPATLGTIFTPATDETTAAGFDGTFATDGANAIRVNVTQTGATLTCNWTCMVRYQSISLSV